MISMISAALAEPVTASHSEAQNRPKTGGPGQELPDLGGLAAQHLLGQELDDEPVVAGGGRTKALGEECPRSESAAR